MLLISKREHETRDGHTARTDDLTTLLRDFRIVSIVSTYLRLKQALNEFQLRNDLPSLSPRGRNKGVRLSPN